MLKDQNFCARENLRFVKAPILSNRAFFSQKMIHNLRCIFNCVGLCFHWQEPCHTRRIKAFTPVTSGNETKKRSDVLYVECSK